MAPVKLDLKAPKSSQVGVRLKRVRGERGLTTRELARMASVPHSAITETELGNRIPRANTLEKLAVALRVAPSWLVYGEGPAPEGYRQEPDGEDET